VLERDVVIADQGQQIVALQQQNAALQQQNVAFEARLGVLEQRAGIAPAQAPLGLPVPSGWPLVAGVGLAGLGWGLHRRR
jgi:hypothetical protein